eukprot:GILI01021379.1.p1 GENE.GILI01021379.1~~GILI01021379.1.p1  ORF type:complete len:578 (-),score=110.87 GILI01021379.1:303-2036(-)
MAHEAFDGQKADSILKNGRSLLESIKNTRHEILKVDSSTTKMSSWRDDILALTSAMDDQLSLCQSLRQAKERSWYGSSSTGISALDRIVAILAKDIRNINKELRHYTTLPDTDDSSDVALSWDVLSHQVEAEIAKVFDIPAHVDPVERMAQSMASLLSLKDHLLSQLLKGLLYRKNVLYCDLGIEIDEYTNEEGVEAAREVLAHFQKNRFVRPLLTLDNKLDDSVVYGSKVEVAGSKSVQASLAVARSFLALESVIKNGATFGQESKGSSNGLVGLREELEQAHETIRSLEEEIRTFKASKQSSKQQEWMEMHRKLGDLKLKLAEAHKSRDKLQVSNTQLNGANFQLTAQVTDLSGRLQRIESTFLPRLDTLESLVKDTQEVMAQINTDVSLLATMYRARGEELNESRRQETASQERIKSLNAQLLETEKKLIGALQEVKRRDVVINKVMAARQVMKDTYQANKKWTEETRTSNEELVKCNEQLTNQVATLKSDMAELHASGLRFSVRIDELERQKKRLLDTLAQLGVEISVVKMDEEIRQEVAREQFQLQYPNALRPEDAERRLGPVSKVQRSNRS